MIQSTSAYQLYFKYFFQPISESCLCIPKLEIEICLIKRKILNLIFDKKQELETEVFDQINIL